MSDKDDRDNRANQLNSNNSAYHSSRGWGKTECDDDDGESGGSISASHGWYRPEPKYLKLVVTTRGEIVETVFTGHRDFQDPLVSHALQKGKSWYEKSPELLMREHLDWASVSIVRADIAYAGQTTGQLIGHFNGAFSWSASLASFLLRLAPRVHSYLIVDFVNTADSSGRRFDPKLSEYSLSKERVLMRRRLRYGILHIPGFLPWLEHQVHPRAIEAFRNCGDLKRKLEIVLDYRYQFGFPVILRECEFRIRKIEPELRANLEYRASGKRIANRLNEYFGLKGIPPIASKLLTERFEYSK